MEITGQDNMSRAELLARLTIEIDLFVENDGQKKAKVTGKVTVQKQRQDTTSTPEPRP